MDPQTSVLLYSKYSPSCQNLMELMESSNVNFKNIISLQTLCVDNEKVRERIKQNRQFDITSVPCILLIYPDGGIEKYDGINHIQWVNQMITKHSPQPPQPPPPPQKTQEQKWLEEKEREKQLIEQEKKKIQMEREKIREENKRKFEERRGLNRDSSNGNRRKLITNIEDLPSEDEDEDENENDRYRQRKPVGQLRSDSGNYTQGEELFPGQQLNNRQPIKSTVKTSNTKSNKNISIMERAKELAKGREDISPPQ